MQYHVKITSAGVESSSRKSFEGWDRLDGHMVQGHYDGVGMVLSFEEAAESWVLWVRFPMI